jgi:IS6 family transposase
LKLLIPTVCGFKSMQTAYATIKDFETRLASRNGQVAPFSLQGGMGEKRLIELAFGLGPSALAVAAELVKRELETA